MRLIIKSLLVFALCVFLMPNVLVAKEKSKDTIYLNTIGTFSASFIIQSYGYIGVLADSVTKDVYEPKFVKSILSENTTYLRNVSKQLKQYGGSEFILSSADKKFVGDVIEITDLLIKEADALSAYVDSRTGANKKNFDAARERAWVKIKKTFDIS